MTVFLHHYPASLFSEKVRLLLGYHQTSWESVEISSVMPRPLLMPLSGGYRKTPILQIDANVYCDTNVIARGLARLHNADELFAQGFVADRVAEWADTQLFRVVVALNFAPAAIATMMGQFTPDEMAAFQKDRAELSAGASITTFTPEAGAGYLNHYLTALDSSLTGQFLFGDTPSIADFSVYHCLWFLNNNEVNAALLTPYKSVLNWMQRMAQFGHGTVTTSSGEAALAHAAESLPQTPQLDGDLPTGLSLGASVSVTPVDYGRIPVSGRLVAMSVDEVVIERDDNQAGKVMVHFPTPGFDVVLS